MVLGLNTPLAAAFVSLALATPAAAHHSFAMYDREKTVEVVGTVKAFQWSNPHALLWVVGGVGNETPQLWSIELPTSPGPLARMGWTKRSLNPGDRVVVDINPLRDGQRGGALKKVLLSATGQVLTTTPASATASTR
jgi:hypothetical protein